MTHSMTVYLQNLATQLPAAGKTSRSLLLALLALLMPIAAPAAVTEIRRWAATPTTTR